MCTYKITNRFFRFRVGYKMNAKAECKHMNQFMNNCLPEQDFGKAAININLQVLKISTPKTIFAVYL